MAFGVGDKATLKSVDDPLELAFGDSDEFFFGRWNRHVVNPDGDTRSRRELKAFVFKGV